MDLEYIIDIVNERLGINIKSENRKREYVNGRFMFMRLAKDLNPHYTLSAIGKSLKKNHATVLYGHKMFQNILNFKQEPELIEVYFNLLASLKNLKNLNETGFGRTKMILRNIKPLQKYYAKPI